MSELYEKYAHMIQTGIEFLMHHRRTLVEPKHLRVGINLAHVTDAALAELLIQKGVFTKEEYLAQLDKSCQEEAMRTQEEVREILGPHVDIA